MPKNTSRQKRKAPKQTKPIKKQTKAAKKKHVQGLAKTGRWKEIENLYGEKVRVKAKAYLERIRKTPQEIAREILIKNGLLPSASQAETNIEAAPIAYQETESRTEVHGPLCCIENTSSTLTTEQKEMIEKRRQQALEKRRSLSSLPGTLTKEQQDRIEVRRKEALEKRRRAQQYEKAHAITAPSPNVIQSDVIDKLQHGMHKTFNQINQEATQVSWKKPSEASVDTTHCIVIPESPTPTISATETDQVRPDDFWDDIEAAAEIVLWENEHQAEGALELPTENAVSNDNQNTNTSVSKQIRPGNVKVGTTSDAAIPSISQELVAAAEIIQWETNHENYMNASNNGVCRPSDDSDSDPVAKAPQLQLLPVQVTDDSEHEQEAIVTQSRDGCEMFEPDLCRGTHDKLKPHRKRLMAAAPQSTSPHSNADHSNAFTSRIESQTKSTSSHQEFIDKHLLENKLELPVLEFLEMMLC